MSQKRGGGRSSGDTDFDFSSLIELLNLMKRKFWTYDRNQERYKRERARLTNTYFQKLNPRGQQSATSTKIEKALKEVAKNQAKSVEVAAGAKGANKASKGADANSQGKQATTLHSFHGNHADILMDELNDAELNEILGSTGEIDLNSITKVLHNKVIARSIDEMRRKQVKNHVNEEFIIKGGQGVQRLNSQNANKPAQNTSQKAQIGDTKSGLMSSGDWIKKRSSSVHGIRLHGQGIVVEKAQKERVPSDWFKTYIRQSGADRIIGGAYNNSDDNEYMVQVNELKRKSEIFFSEELQKLRYDEYQTFLEDETLREKIAMMLLDKHDHLKSSSIREISKQLTMADKDLFVKLKDGQYTMDQLKARIAERKNNIKYTVLDDLKDVLDPDFFKEPSKNVSSKLGQQISRKRCLFGKQSGQSYFFHTGRDDGMKVRDYSYMPESLGTVDFNPNFTIEKFVKPIPVKDNRQVTNIHQQLNNQSSVIGNQNTMATHGLSGTQVGIQNDPQQLLKMTAQDKKKAKEEADRRKKIKNIDKLKETLAQKLAVHRQIELSQMPFDSSKQEFHDKMDILIQMNKRRAQATKDLLVNSNQTKKVNVSKGKKQDGKQKGKQNEEHLLAAFEQRKLEQKERRFKLLFLKKLELDGAEVIMTAQDRELLKNYESEKTLRTRDEESGDAEDFIDKAIETDVRDTMTPSERRRYKQMQRIKSMPMAPGKSNNFKMKQMMDQCAKTKAVSNLADKLKQKQKKKDQLDQQEELFSTGRGAPIMLVTQRNQEHLLNKAQSYEQKLAELSNELLMQLASAAGTDPQHELEKLTSLQQTYMESIKLRQGHHSHMSSSPQTTQLKTEIIPRSISSPNINKSYRVGTIDAPDMFTYPVGPTKDNFEPYKNPQYDTSKFSVQDIMNFKISPEKQQQLQSEQPKNNEPESPTLVSNSEKNRHQVATNGKRQIIEKGIGSEAYGPEEDQMDNEMDDDCQNQSRMKPKKMLTAEGSEERQPKDQLKKRQAASRLEENGTGAEAGSSNPKLQSLFVDSPIRHQKKQSQDEKLSHSNKFFNQEDRTKTQIASQSKVQSSILKETVLSSKQLRSNNNDKQVSNLESMRDQIDSIPLKQQVSPLKMNEVFKNIEKNTIASSIEQNKQLQQDSLNQSKLQLQNKNNKSNFNITHQQYSDENQFNQPYLQQQNSTHSISQELRQFVNKFGIQVVEQNKTEDLTSCTIAGPGGLPFEGSNITKRILDSPKTKSIGSALQMNVNYKTQPVLQILQSPNYTNREVTQLPNEQVAPSNMLYNSIKTGVGFNNQNQMVSTTGMMNKTDGFKSSYQTMSANRGTIEGGAYDLPSGSRNHNMANSSLNQQSKRLVQSQNSRSRMTNRRINQMNQLTSHNIQHNKNMHNTACRCSKCIEDKQLSENNLGQGGSGGGYGSLSIGAPKSPKTQHSSKSYTQQRLKTALQMSRQRKMNFNQQLRHKNSHNATSGLDDCATSATVGRFGGKNIHLPVTIGQSEEAKEDLRSIQLDSLHFDIVKNQCKIQGDYKSMAAVARIQKKNNENAIEKLQNKLMFDMQINKLRNSKLSQIQKARVAAEHSNLMQRAKQQSGAISGLDNQSKQHTIWRNLSIRDMGSNDVNNTSQQVMLQSQQIGGEVTNHSTNIQNSKSLGAFLPRSSTGYGSRNLKTYKISNRIQKDQIDFTSGHDLQRYDENSLQNLMKSAVGGSKGVFRAGIGSGLAGGMKGSGNLHMTQTTMNFRDKVSSSNEIIGFGQDHSGNQQDFIEKQNALGCTNSSFRPQGAYSTSIKNKHSQRFSRMSSENEKTGDLLKINKKLRINMGIQKVATSSSRELEQLKWERGNSSASPAKVNDKEPVDPQDDSNLTLITPHAIYEQTRKSSPGIDAKRLMNFSQNSDLQQLAHSSTMNQNQQQLLQQTIQQNKGDHQGTIPSPSGPNMNQANVDEMDRLLLGNQI